MTQQSLAAPDARPAEAQRPRLPASPFALAWWTAFGLALALRLLQLSDPDLGQDGGLSLAIARQDLPRLLELSARDVHPPLYYLLLHLWTGLVGLGPVAVKSLNLGLSLLLLVGLDRLGRALGGRRAGLLTLTLGAGSLTIITTTWNVRDFLLSAALLVASSLAFLQLSGAGAPPGRRLAWWAGYAGVNALGLLCSYLFAPALAAQAGALLLRRRAPDLRPWAAAWLLSGLAAAPWYLWLAPATRSASLLGSSPWSQGGVGPLETALAALAQQLAGGPVAALVVGALLAGWVRHRLAGADRTVLAYLLLALAVELAAVAAVLVLWYQGPPPTRYTLQALPFFLPLAGGALDHALGRWRPVGLLGLAVLVGSSLWNVRGWVAMPPFAHVWQAPEMVRQLDRHTAPPDALVFLSPEQAGYYALLSAAPRAWRPLFVSQQFLAGDVEREIAWIEANLAARYERVWLVMDGGTQESAAGRRVQQALAERCFPLDPLRQGDHRLVPHLCDAAADPPVHPGARFGGLIELQAAQLTREVERHRLLLVSLRWRALAAPDQDYTVFVHLADASGRPLAQHDGPPAAGTRPTSGWRPGDEVLDRHPVWLPSDLPAGRYRVLVGLYRGATRLPLETGATFVEIAQVDL